MCSVIPWDDEGLFLLFFALAGGGRCKGGWTSCPVSWIVLDSVSAADTISALPRNALPLLGWVRFRGSWLGVRN